MSNPIVKFGIKQLANPTPEQAKKAFMAFFKVTASVAIILQFFPQIPKHLSDSISTYLIDANGAVYAFSRLFGIDISAPVSK